MVVVGAAAFEEAGAVGSAQRVLGTGEGCGPSGFYKDQQRAGRHLEQLGGELTQLSCLVAHIHLASANTLPLFQIYLFP